MTGCVFDIQRFSLHDGAGIRTTVFFKGCPLRCKWCCNPESMNPRPELLFNRELCIGCGKCAQVCPMGAASATGICRSKCTDCGICAETCYAEALHMKGRYYTPQDILNEVVKDIVFYKRTDGGVTFSGGEPLTQIEFLAETLRLCQQAGIATAIETCGYVPWASFQEINALVDVFLYDIKSMNGEKHLEYTGVRCEKIHENCERLAKIAKRLVIRVPVVPLFNFDVESLTNIVRFAERIGVQEVDFLPYHRFAAKKYSLLDRDYWDPGITKLSESDIAPMIANIQTTIKLRIGG